MNPERTPRVLVVDDNLEHREALGKIFAREGYAVALARDGEEAIGVLASQPFDLIVTDLRMPRRGGLDVLRAARARRPGIPIIIVTAFGEAISLVEAMAVGASDYLHKPLRREEILAAARRALRGRVPGGGGAQGGQESSPADRRAPGGRGHG